MNKRINYENIDILELMELVEEQLDSDYETQKIIRGTNLMVSCPYHKDDHPSAGIALEGKHKGVFHCFGCGKSVPFEAYASAIIGRDRANRIIGENLIFLRSQTKINLGFKEDRKGNNSYLLYVDEYNDYLESRGISKEIYKRFELGFNKSANTIIFPIFDTKGNHLFNQIRSIDKKYFANGDDADKTKALYGIHEVYKVLWTERPKELWITESIIDALYLWENGYYAVALLGASISDYQAQLINKLPITRINIATDNDTAGNIAAVKVIRALKNKEMVRVIMPKEAKDINDVKDFSKLSFKKASEWQLKSKERK